MGCHAACAITAVAVQDSTRVEDALLIDDEWLDDQARAVLQDMPVAAIKVGAVGGSDNAQAIAEILADYPELPVVFDPLPAVRASSSGSEEQADAELMTVLRELIVPQSTVMTLSLEQARRWLALAADDDAPEDWDAARCARELLEWGPEFVLITSAETVGNLIVNRLFGPDNSVQSESIEHVDLRFRGAGDTLSAAIAALLAQGIEVGDACAKPMISCRSRWPAASASAWAMRCPTGCSGPATMAAMMAAVAATVMAPAMPTLRAPTSRTRHATDHTPFLCTDPTTR